MVSKDQKVVKSLLKILKKKYRELPVLLGKKRPVLEHLIYASFLENTSIETANQSFAFLERYFIDWNEIRVSTSSELASVFPKLHDPIRTGERIRRTLQFLFEKHYKFDFEELRSRNKTEVVQFLNDIPFLTHFIVDYVTHLLFNSPVVPLDEGSLRVMRLLNQVQVDEQNREVVPILEDEDSGCAEIFPWLHELGAAFIVCSDSSEVVKILTTVDPDASGRSWTSLVETTEDDPAEIAKKVAKREKKSKLSAILPLEEIDLDESGDPDIVVDDVSSDFGFDAEHSWENDENVSTSDGEESSAENEKTKSTSRKTKKRERSAKSSSRNEQETPSDSPSPTASRSPDKESLVFLDELDAETPKPKRKSRTSSRSTELKNVVSDDANQPSLSESVSETVRSESVVAQTVETSKGVASSATVVVSESSVTTVVRNKKSGSTTKTEASSLVASSETIVKFSTETIVSSDSISETTSKLEKNEKTTTRKSSRKNKEASPVADDSSIREQKPKNKNKKVQSQPSFDSSQDEPSDSIQNNDEIYSNRSTSVSPKTQNKIVSPDVLMTENADDERDNGKPKKVRETSDVDSNGNDSPESLNSQPETPR